MEFPDLGKHCSEVSCHQIDFLPMKCDACQGIFCTDHFMYSKHGCPSAYKKDNQVPICPLCNQPVPTRRGEMPDIAVSSHIDDDCRSDKATSKRIFTNKCSKKGCKTKEFVKVTCEKCMQNFCLRHRHSNDHDCPGPSIQQVSTRSGAAALQRLQHNQAGTSRAVPSKQNNTSHSVLQAGLSEDEALARALQASLSQNVPGMTQEERDRQLAMSLSLAEQHQPATAPTSRSSGCHIS